VLLCFIKLILGNPSPYDPKVLSEVGQRTCTHEIDRSATLLIPLKEHGLASSSLLTLTTFCFLS